MQKAFIFDMDGVIINSEQSWGKYSPNFLEDLLGADIAKRVGHTIGITINTIYDKAVQYGFSMPKEEYAKRYDQQALLIYKKSEITEDLDKLVAELLKRNCHLGLVSSSRQLWIDHVLSRLSFADKLERVISLNERPDLKPKPHPDGYIEVIKKLKSTPQNTVILEDSNSGIQAAKGSGAYTIGFRKNLLPGYIQKGADIFADTIEDVINIVRSL